MDPRLIALRALSHKPTLIDEFSDYYEDLLKDLSEQEDFVSLRAAREILDAQVTFVTDLALSCDDAPGSGLSRAHEKRAGHKVS